MDTDELMRLPWGWQGPQKVEEAGEEPFYELRIRELPDFYIAARSLEAALAEAGPALRAFLESYTDLGETPPLPEDTRPSWQLDKPPLVSRPQELLRVWAPARAILSS